MKRRLLDTDNDGAALPAGQTEPKTLLYPLVSDNILSICEFLDPLSLYYLSRTNTIIEQLAKANNLWHAHISQHFKQNSTCSIISNTQQHYYYGLFSQFVNPNYKGKYKGFTHKEKEFFILVTVNDLFTIKQRRIIFNINLLNKSDNDGNILLDIVRRNNNPDLNNYIFNQLYENDSYTDEVKILFGIQLNQSIGLFADLLRGKKIDEIIINKQTLLFIAVTNNSINTVQLLLNLQASIDLTVNESNTPLYAASEHGNLAMVELLLANDANINAHSIRGASSLYVAMQNGHTSTVKFLLSKGADIRQQFEGNTPLCVGAQNGHIEGIKLLLPYCNINDINTRNEVGGTPILIAAENGYADICELLLQRRADPNDRHPSSGYTALYLACQNGHHHAVEVLLRFKANTTYLPPNEKTLLYIAASNGHASVVKLLCQLENMENFINCKYKRSTPLHAATVKDDFEVVKILVEAGADINSVNLRTLETALFRAIQNGNLKIVEFLIQQGANIHLANSNGLTPLHACVLLENYEILLPMIKVLILAGANLTAKNLKGYTATDTAECLNHDAYNILKMLEKFADIQFNEACLPSLAISKVTDKIEEFIHSKNENDMVSFTLNQATSWLYLLKNVSGVIGQSIILLSLLAINNKNALGNVAIRALEFFNVEEAKNTLVAQLEQSLKEDVSLNITTNIFNPIIETILTNKEFSAKNFGAVILGLNFIDMQFSKSQLMLIEPHQQMSPSRLLI